MGTKRVGSCGRDRRRDWRVGNANSEAVADRSRRHVVLEERVTPLGIRDMVAMRMRSYI